MIKTAVERLASHAAPRWTLDGSAPENAANVTKYLISCISPPQLDKIEIMINSEKLKTPDFSDVPIFRCGFSEDYNSSPSTVDKSSALDPLCQKMRSNDVPYTWAIFIPI